MLNAMFCKNVQIITCTHVGQLSFVETRPAGNLVMLFVPSQGVDLKLSHNLIFATVKLWVSEQLPAIGRGRPPGAPSPSLPSRRPRCPSASSCSAGSGWRSCACRKCRCAAPAEKRNQLSRFELTQRRLRECKLKLSDCALILQEKPSQLNII